jgi:hypothetical protein
MPKNQMLRGIKLPIEFSISNIAYPYPHPFPKEIQKTQKEIITQRLPQRKLRTPQKIK